MCFMKFVSVILPGLCAVAGMACGGGKTVYQEILRPVRVAEVASFGVMESVYTGVVEAEEYGKLAFKVAGPLVEMNVEAGQEVKKGAVIAAVDPSDYRLRFEAGRAAFVTAQSQLARDKRLLAMQAVSQQEYELAEAAFVRARSAYETARNTLEDTKLRAPFDGFVEEKYVENYQKVQPGEPVVKLVNPDKLEVYFILPETDVRLTGAAMQAVVEFDTYPGRWFRAEAKEFVDASPGGSGIPVRLVLADTAFRPERYHVYPGFSCRVKLLVDNAVGVGQSVPLSALFRDMATEEISVWLYDAVSGTVARRAVELGTLFGSDRVRVTAGLEADDVVVVAGGAYLTGGQQVVVLSND